MLDSSLQISLKQSLEATYQFVFEQALAGLDWLDLAHVIRDRQLRSQKDYSAYSDTLPTWACLAAGGETMQAIPLAAAWVCYNMASDIFDDLQDKDGKQRPWNQWEPERAMQVGVGLIAVAQTCLAQLNEAPAAQSDILGILGRTMALAALGQNIATRASLDEYFKHTLAKSGLVFAAVVYAGARLQTNEPSLLQAMYDFGLALGMLIQIRDDCRDLLPEQAASDLARATYTLPVLYGLSQQEHRLRPRLVALLETANDDHTLEIGRILTDMGALAYSLAVAKVYEQKALSALSVFPAARTVHLITYVSHFLAFQTTTPGH